MRAKRELGDFTALMLGIITVVTPHIALAQEGVVQRVAPVEPYTIQIDDNKKNLLQKRNAPVEASIFSSDGPPRAPGTRLYDGLVPGKRVNIVVVGEDGQPYDELGQPY